MEQMKIKTLFIGAGRMAQAIIKGLTRDERFAITVANNGNEQRLHDVRDTYGVEVTSNWSEEIEQSDVIILAMPPEEHTTVVGAIAPLVKEQIIATVAAGIGPSWLEEHLAGQPAVAWIMPNTAAEVGESSTIYASGQYLTKQQEKIVETILMTIGAFEKVSEEQVHSLTAITGSAPAFVYKLAESFIQLALETGVTQEQAQNMVAQMILGSATMLSSGESPKSLMDQVATPGGSTAAGLNVLEGNNFDRLWADVIQACRDKASKETN